MSCWFVSLLFSKPGTWNPSDVKYAAAGAAVGQWGSLPGRCMLEVVWETLSLRHVNKEWLDKEDARVSHVIVGPESSVQWVIRFGLCPSFMWQRHSAVSRADQHELSREKSRSRSVTGDDQRSLDLTEKTFRLPHFQEMSLTFLQYWYEPCSVSVLSRERTVACRDGTGGFAGNSRVLRRCCCRNKEKKVWRFTTWHSSVKVQQHESNRTCFSLFLQVKGQEKNRCF